MFPVEYIKKYEVNRGPGAAGGKETSEQHEYRGNRQYGNIRAGSGD